MAASNPMDDLFERFLPSASDEQVESARWQLLSRLRADIAAVRESAEPRILNYGDYHILLVLAGGERHGYDIMSEVEDVTEGATKFGPGTLYTSINRLLVAGLIEESQTRPDFRIDEEPRRHFRLTGLGQKVLAAESERRAAMRPYAAPRQIVRPI